MNKIKAVSLLSGGLDSIIAAKIISNLGIDVTALYFSSPFWSSETKENIFIKKVSDENNLNIKVIPIEDDYFDIIVSPSYGWGKQINPCVDCKIYMLKRAKKIMEEIGAKFIISGEVLGQRPMSQHRSALNYIEKNAGVRDLLIRPLSAKLLPPTIAEKNGWINKEDLYDISGRSRKRQLEIAKKLNIKQFTSPAGGCLLTDERYAIKLKDLLDHRKNLKMKDAYLIKGGRHFRFNNSKIIVGRDREENDLLIKYKNDNDYYFVVPNCGSPNTILQEEINQESIKLAAELTLAFSNCKLEETEVNYYDDKNQEYKIKVIKKKKSEFNDYNILII